VPSIASLVGRLGSIKVVYAGEALEESLEKRRMCSATPVRYPDHLSEDDHNKRMTTAKYVAMKREAELFYSSYPGQSWKNVLSIGDMAYEHDAAQDLTFRHKPKRGTHERLWTKTLVVPSAPSLSEITMRLHFLRLMLPVYVRFEGNFDLNLSKEVDPLFALARTLRMPELAKANFSRHAWGLTSQPSHAVVSDMIAELEEIVCVPRSP
jgi:hypothetical protein